MAIPDYKPDPVPGDWDHRGGDCVTHGDNVPFFRPKGVTGPYYCVECVLKKLREEIDD
jgi:hypothetical protein